MPSGSKRKKAAAAAAKKRKEQGSSVIGSTATTASTNGDEELKTQDSDGCELGFPARDYRQEQHPFGEEGVKESSLVGATVFADELTKEVVEIGEAPQEPVGSEDEAIEIARELKQEESGNGDATLQTGGRANGLHIRSSSSSSSSSSGSNDESQDTKKRPNLELERPLKEEAENIPTALVPEKQPKEEAEKIPTALLLEKQPEEDVEKIPTALLLEKQPEEDVEKIPTALVLEKQPEEDVEKIPTALVLEKQPEEKAEKIPTALEFETQPEEEVEIIQTDLELEKQPEEEAEKIQTALVFEKLTEKVEEQIPIVLELEKPSEEGTENVPVLLELGKPEEESIDLVEVHWVQEADLAEEIDSVREVDFVQKVDLSYNEVSQVQKNSRAVEAHNFIVETEHVIDTIEPTMTVPENIIEVSESDTLESAGNGKEAKFESKEKEEIQPESKESEDELLPLSNVDYGSSCGIDTTKGTEDKQFLSSTAATRETSNGMEHVKDSDAESQLLRAVAPRVVQTSSWRGCCGLFELLTGSRG